TLSLRARPGSNRQRSRLVVVRGGDGHFWCGDVLGRGGECPSLQRGRMAKGKMQNAKGKNVRRKGESKMDRQTSAALNVLGGLTGAAIALLGILLGSSIARMTGGEHAETHQEQAVSGEH